MQKMNTFIYNLTFFLHENFLHKLLALGGTNSKPIE